MVILRDFLQKIVYFFGLVSVIRRQIVSNPLSRSGQEVLTTVGKPQIRRHVLLKKVTFNVELMILKGHPGWIYLYMNMNIIT